MSLRHAFPGGRRVPVGGRARRASALRLIDLAALEGVAARLSPDPSAVIDPAQDSPEYRRLIRAAATLAESGFSWGSPGCDRIIFGTEPGLRAFLRRVFRRDRDPAGPPEPADIAPGEWPEIERVAFGLDLDPLGDVLREIDRLTGAEFASGPPAEGVPWSVALHETIEACGLDYSVVGRWPLTRLRHFRSGGRVEHGTAADMSATSIEAARRRAAFWAEPDEEASPPPPPTEESSPDVSDPESPAL